MSSAPTVGPLQEFKSPIRCTGRPSIKQLREPVTSTVTLPHMPKSPTLAAGRPLINTVGDPVVIYPTGVNGGIGQPGHSSLSPTAAQGLDIVDT